MNAYVQAAYNAAVAAGINPYVFLGMIQQESSFNPSAVSSKGCQGIAQICDAVPFSPLDVSASLQYAAQRIANSLKTCGSYAGALAQYNSGQCNGVTDPGYVSSIFSNAQTWAAQFGHAVGGAGVTALSPDASTQIRGALGDPLGAGAGVGFTPGPVDPGLVTAVLIVIALFLVIVVWHGASQPQATEVVENAA